MSQFAIDNTRITAMVAQLRAAATAMNKAPVSPMASAEPQKLDFAQALKASLDKVAAAENHAGELSKQFAMGDDNVNLSDVMISMQKANIGLQTAIAVRSKLVSAYQTIMNMQV